MASSQLNAWLARPWRRVALTARALPWPETRLLLSDVAATTNALPPLEQSYRRQWPAQPEDLAATQRTDWLRVQSAFRVAGLRLRQEFGRVVSGLLERLVGGRRPAPLQAEGARHLVRPLAELLVALQHATARDNDLRQIREARFSHGLAALRRIGPYAPPETPPRNAGRIRTPPLAPWPDHHRWPWVLRMLDRPAVWKASRDLPDSAALQTSRKEWLLQLESCRLALALRAYHDLHGRWPAAWQDLVPDILPAVPIDPFSNQPFGYESSPNGWEFWSVDAIGRRPTPDAAQDPSQKLFRSSEFGAAP